MELKLTEEQIKLACDFILTAKFELDKKQIPVIFNAKIVTLPGVVGSFLEYNLIEQYLKKDFITIIIPVKRIDLDVALKNVVFQAKCFLKVLGVNYENMNTNENLETPVTDFDFSVRLLNCLKAAEINTLFDLTQITRRELMMFRNFGKKSMSELEDFMESRGLKFKG